jgi:hypothetical protein
MRDEYVIQAFDLDQFCRFGNAIGITAVETTPAGVNEQRLAGGADDEGGLAAFDIDEKHLEAFGLEERSRAKQGQDKSETKQLG